MNLNPFQGRSSGESVDPTYRHSFMFRRLFEDYKTYEYIDTDGIIRKKTVYTGRLYTPPFTQARYRLRKLLYFALWLAACALTYLAGSQALPVNLHPVTVAVQIAEIVLLCWVMIAVWNYCLASYERTIGEHKTSTKMMILSSFWCAIVLAAAALESLVFVFISRPDLPRQLLCFGAQVLAAGAIWLLRALEKRVEYKVRVSEPDIPIDHFPKRDEEKAEEEKAPDAD